MIKHNPSGLFPHFDSGIERRPYFVKTGDKVEIGCRIDDASEAEAVSMDVSWAGGETTIPGEYHSTNGAGQRYFRFSYSPEPDVVEFRYRFITSSGEQSRTYCCKVLTELFLTPIEVEDGKEKQLLYKTDTMDLRLKIQTHPCIRILLFDNSSGLVGKRRTDKNFSKAKALEFTDEEGHAIFRLWPELRLMVDTEGTVHNLSFRAELPGTACFGLGEKFDSVDQRGKKPLNYVVEQFSNQQDKTYIPIPFVFTDGGVSFRQEGSYPSRFDFSLPAEKGWIGLEIFSCCPDKGALFSASIHTGTPAQLLTAYAEETGSPKLPPKWAFGPWISSNGWNTQSEALEQLEKLEATAIPATVMVLEAWSDEETFYIWNNAQYTPRKGGEPVRYSDFTFPSDGRWPNPKDFCEALKENGLKLILWQIPVIKYEASKHGEQLDLDWEYALENGLCLRDQDGAPYQITEMWFGNSLIPDFTNPKTLEWWHSRRRYLVEELDVAGFKTDGGEFLFDPECVFYDGRTVLEAHNDFPNIYESAYSELLSDRGGVTFSRAGFTGAQRYPIHWAGDQVSDFSELRAQLTAGLSLGLSGVPFWGFDIGGFAGNFPTTELYLRSSAFAAFAPVMQFHSEPRYGQYYMVERNHWNNDRSPWNMAEANSDSTIIPVYRLFSNLRMNLMPYIWNEAQNCASTVRPMMAHLIYDYPYDPVSAGIDDEYMFGRDLLVAPVVTEGAAGRQVWFPEGKWNDFWTGSEFAGGGWVSFDCPIDRIPAFVRSGSALPVNINSSFCMGSLEKSGAMSNRIDGYENLCFLLYGERGKYDFTDDLGNDITIVWDAGGETMNGRLTAQAVIFRMDGIDHGEVTGHIFGREIRGERKGRTWDIT